MNIKMNAGLFEVDNHDELNEMTLYELEKLLSLMKKYKMSLY